MVISIWEAPDFPTFDRFTAFAMNSSLGVLEGVCAPAILVQFRAAARTVASTASGRVAVIHLLHSK
jgi:hypothetical protein